MSETLPIKTTDEFIADVETMDLSELKNETFLVAVSTGDRSKHKFLTSTVRGPYSFVEMCDEVGNMWYDFQHHAKVVICQKDREKTVKNLDENTVDYIEAFYKDIVVECMLEGLFDDKTYTCKAGIIQSDDKELPVAQVALESDEEEDL